MSEVFVCVSHNLYLLLVKRVSVCCISTKGEASRVPDFVKFDTL